MLVEAKEAKCGVCFNRAVYALESGLRDLGLGLVWKRVNLRYFLEEIETHSHGTRCLQAKVYSLFEKGQK